VSITLLHYVTLQVTGLCNLLKWLSVAKKLPDGLFYLKDFVVAPKFKQKLAK